MKSIEELEELSEMIRILPCWSVDEKFVKARDVKEHPLCENLAFIALVHIAAIIRDSPAKSTFQREGNIITKGIKQ